MNVEHTWPEHLWQKRWPFARLTMRTVVEAPQVGHIFSSPTLTQCLSIALLRGTSVFGPLRIAWDSCLMERSQGNNGVLSPPNRLATSSQSNGFLLGLHSGHISRRFSPNCVHALLRCA